MEQKPDFSAFSQADIRKLFGSAEGRKLLALLNRDGGAALRRAADAVKAGDTALAQEIMRPVMESPDAEALIRKLNET